MSLLLKNRALAMVNAAHDGGYAVLATACYNIEGIIALVRAAEAKKSPVIINLLPHAVEFADGLLVHAAQEAADKASVPVAVHMDHAQSPEIVKRAADIGGLDGIMVDMSHYDEKENKTKTEELTAFLHEKGIIAEAEPGRIHGGEKGFVADTGKLEGVLTTLEQAEEFMALGIDWLAPAFGNHHGNYGPQGPQLDYNLLSRIHEKAKGRVQLVLHGTNDFDKAIFQRCIERGVAKCHINNVMNDRWSEVQRNNAGRAPITTVIEEGTLAMQKVVETYMDWVGSTGKA